MASTSKPVEKIMNLTETKQQLSRVINEVARGDSYIVVEKNGLESAVIIDLQEFRRYQRYAEEQRQQRAQFFGRLARLGDAFKDVSDEELERELQKAQDAVKDDMAKALSQK